MKNPLTFRIESWFGVFLLFSATAFVLIVAFSALNNFNDEVNGIISQYQLHQESFK